MLWTWPIAHRWKFLGISVRAWKSPDWICWLCSAPWTAWICPLRKSRNVSYGNSLKRMPIVQKLFGRWTRLDRRAMLRHTLTVLDQLASLSDRFRKQLPARAHPTLQLLVGNIRKALNPKEAYNMVPGRDPENA